MELQFSSEPIVFNERRITSVDSTLALVLGVNEPLGDSLSLSNLVPPLSQVEVLEKEMSHTGGVKVMLRRTDCHHTIALVDYNHKVWYVHQAFMAVNLITVIRSAMMSGFCFRTG